MVPATFLSRYPAFLAVPKHQELSRFLSFVYHLRRSPQNIQPVYTLADLPGFSRKRWWMPPWPCNAHILHAYRMKSTHLDAKMLNSRPVHQQPRHLWATASVTSECLCGWTHKNTGRPLRNTRFFNHYCFFVTLTELSFGPPKYRVFYF